MTRQTSAHDTRSPISLPGPLRRANFRHFSIRQGRAPAKELGTTPRAPQVEHAIRGKPLESLAGIMSSPPIVRVETNHPRKVCIGQEWHISGRWIRHRFMPGPHDTAALAPPRFALVI